jgi:hypothetical protein
MKPANPFEQMLELPGIRRRASLARIAPEVVDVLELAWAAAQSVFEEDAKPEHAIMLLPIFLDRADAERSRGRGEGAPQN